MPRCIAFLRAVNIGGRLAAPERRIEAQLQATFGFEIDTFVRTAAELAAIGAHARRAFDAAEAASAKTHVVGFIAAAPDAATAKLIERFHTDVERFHLHARDLHRISRDKQSETKFSNATFERALKTRAPFRNITTLRKLVAMSGER